MDTNKKISEHEGYTGSALTPLIAIFLCLRTALLLRLSSKKKKGIVDLPPSLLLLVILSIVVFLIAMAVVTGIFESSGGVVDAFSLAIKDFIFG